jgi:alkanesulfonate monooxygenase SsuD/methylene tetrahydromethanopterin reductase-like flavin-dependent oxidoreductase (luciferase family)
MIFQNYGGRLSDAEMLAAEMRTADTVEPLGYDKLWPVEHHVTDYAACPDNTQFLTWAAARTSRIKLATGAFILPWNQPIRVAEKIALLDHMWGGRAPCSASAAGSPAGSTRASASTWASRRATASTRRRR